MFYGTPPQAPLNAPPASPMQPGLQAGADQAIFANIVVIFGPAGGLFIYSPTPGAGNLIGSWSGQAGTDPYGNAYPQGISASAGALLTIGTTSAGIVTGTDSPALLDLKYANTVVASQIYYQSATRWAYIGVLNSNNFVFGTSDNVTVSEAYRISFSGVGSDVVWGSLDQVTMRFTSNVTSVVFENGLVEVNQAQTDYETGALVEFHSGSEQRIDLGATYSIDGFSAPRGLVYYEKVTVPVNSGAVAGTNYAMYTTASAVTFRAGRVYRFTMLNAKIKSAAIQQPHADLYKGTGVAGTLLAAGPRWFIGVVGNDLAFQPDFIFCNSTGANVTTTITLGMAPSAATLVTLDAANTSATALYVLITDIGSTTDMSGTTSV